ncbi:non-ribosomal peptide synthetase [Catenuloplanes japonicus]|uniref:non-ribosomal peptide synthetase n=1 Tax=Catenuloplanes japonicus TaxID=33876 RepID=UPI000524B9E2|nr:non-ribosomal peptide synthetase [Catenuloplanes japonicus]
MTPSLPALTDAPPTLGAALNTAFARYRTAAAIVAGTTTWTYEDLAARVRAVAAGVAAHTDGQAPIVAVVLERSPEFVATVLGVLDAGAVYLPLDPDAPDAYLRQVFEAARPGLVITSPGRAAQLTATTSAPVRTVPGLVTPPATARAATAPEPSSPAYLIYTSGSTGTPKGVLVPHTALLHSTVGRTDRYGPAGRVPLLHSPAFDLTTGVIFWVLLTGGTLVVNPAPLADVAATLDLIHQHDITHLIYPASLYGVLLDRAADRPPVTLRAVGIGSERWSPVLIDRHATVLPGTALINEYGPTEACVCSSYALVYNPTNPSTRRKLPLSLGQPVRGTRYLVLDGAGNPAGTSGELAITGANLALGYLGQPELTSARFVTIGGERAYLTGDLVTYDRDGHPVFLERADRQVQVGGHRVEPGHVETVLLGHPAIRQAHVTARPGPANTGSATLIAYVVPIPGTGIPDGSRGEVWDDYLRERLPAYLIPRAYVVLDDLPRTPAGKIDSSRLPHPGEDRLAPGPDDLSDPLLRYLTETTAGILGVDHVGAHQPLAALGASSLALIRLAAALAADHGVDVPISALFTATTLTGIAGLVRDARPVTRRLLPRPGDAIGKAFPLSGQQEQIWVLTQLAPHARAYNTQFSLHLHGPLDIDALQAALSLIVDRHEILRTTFHDHPDGPVQVVHAPWPAVVDVVDLTGLDDHARETQLTGRMQAAVGDGFDVGRLPLVRWHLFRLGPDRWQLLQVEHHFAHDGWSAQLFLAELRDAYTSLAADREPQLAVLPAQYRDVAVWYRRWRDTDDHAAQLGYWRSQLDGCPDEGPTFTPDRPRPAARSFRGGRLTAHLPAHVVQQLDDLAARHGVSRFAVFLTGFALQVWQHTGAHDIVLGSALVNRRLPGTAPLLGMFVNALPLRVTVDPDAHLGAVLQATMRMLLGAQDHQELPLLDLLADLGRRRDPGRNPLFQLMFAFHDTPRPTLQMGEMTAMLSIEHNDTAKGDLNVVCVPDPSGDGPAGMTILWEYDADLFDPDTAAALLTAFTTLLTQLAQADDQPIRDLDLLGAAETARILALSTGPQDPAPFTSLHAGFDAAATIHPDAVAVAHAGTQLTYRALAASTTRLQAHLTTRGIRAGSIVAIACPAGIELVTAILATLRAGAAYVCLDPTQPPTRTTAMLDDADPDLIITTRRSATVLGRPHSSTVLYADDLPPAPPTTAAVTADAGPDDPAYLVYTSGSTGAPKAVVATHGNACVAVHARTRFLHNAGPRTGTVRTLITLPVIFDVAPHMIMWTLWSGGTVVIPDKVGQVQDPDGLLDLIDRAAITHVNFTASFYRHLLPRIPDGWRPALQVVAVGGEACHPQDITAHAARLPGVALDHEYGPTETTAWCAARRLHPHAPDAPGRVSVGGPLTGYTMTVLDTGGRLLPAGAAGELFIGGAGVAAGYHRRPDLTTARFVTPGTGPLAGQRLYRTGDRARLTRAGFEILGRDDGQVKIRGFRVELGEVAACLRRHPAVTDTAVLCHGDGDTARLVAYIAVPDPREDVAARLQAWAAQHLPPYMTPAAYVVTDSLPRTATGKLQSARLPDPPLADGHGAWPATDRQWLLTRVWRETLQQPALGIDDDFFASGGDSLLAIRAAARATILGAPVSVADLIAAPTVRALDNLITDRPAPEPAPVVARRPAGTILALTPIQEWFFNQEFADPDHLHQARLFTLGTDYDRGVLTAALEWALARHDAFRTRFTHADDTWTARLDDQPLPDLIGHHTLTDPGAPDPALDVLLRDLHHTISIEGGRLATCAIVDDPAGRAWLYLIAHHLIIDAVSWQTLAADIGHAYRLLADRQPVPDGAAPGLPGHDHAAPVVADSRRWHRLAASEKPRLAGATTVTPAPAGSRIQVTRRLSSRAGAYLRLDVPRLHGIGAQAVLLAALRRALSPHTHGTGLYVWLEGHGRTGVATGGLAHVVGWLTTLHPALFTGGDPDPVRLVDAAADIHQQLAAAPDDGISFGEAVLRHPGSELAQHLTAAGLPQITFNYLGQPPGPVDQLLQPAPAPHAATIGRANVLPTPFDVTISPATDGTVTCDFSADPGLLPGADLHQVADRLADQIETAARLVPLTPAARRRPAARTLFLIHPVGGLLDWYTHLVDGLGGSWDCYGIPHDRTTDDLTLPAMARRYLHRIRAAAPSGRYTLAGWCLGGPIAYEIARQAHTDGDSDRIDDVVLIDPPRAETPRNPHEVLITHIHNACPHQSTESVVRALQATAHLPVEERAVALVGLLGPAGPGRPDFPLLSQLRTRLSCHAAMSAWRPAGRVRHLSVHLPRTPNPDNTGASGTWQAYGDALTVTTIPGDHETMLTTDELRSAVDGPHRPDGLR